MNSFVALLRGINVGGKNIIKMADLKTCFESLGAESVTTYIQSGNVVFLSSEASPKKLNLRIEKALSKAFDYNASVVLRSHQQLQNVISKAPKGFGTNPDKYRYDVLFLKDPLTASTAMKSILTKPGVDQAYPGESALYFSRLITKATQSKLGKLTSMPVYKEITIRNWNTTTALLKIMEALGEER